MSLTLHAALVPGWLQVTTSVRGMLDKAEAWCDANEESPAALINARIADDMWPLSRQVKSVWMHSAHALEAAKLGQFVPELSDPSGGFEGLRALLDEARETMLSVDPGELEALADNTLDFVLGGKVRMSFTVQNFLLCFSTPNFYFHAATAYDVLRMNGLDVGKMDFLGKLPVKA